MRRQLVAAGSQDAAVASCAVDALRNATFGSSAQSACLDASGFSFFLMDDAPTHGQVSAMCGAVACRDTVEEVERVAPTECRLGSEQRAELLLYRDILDPVTATCGFGSAHSTTSSSSGDSNRHVQSTGSENAPSGGLGAGTIAVMLLGAIACGLLTAFFTFRYKRRREGLQSKDHERRHHQDGSSFAPLDETDDFRSQRGYNEFAAIAVLSKVSSSMSRASTARSSKHSMGSYTDAAMGSGSFAAENPEAPLEDPALVPIRIPLEKIRFGELLSRGGYGEVYRGTYAEQKKKPTVVAIKKLLPERRQIMKEMDQFLGEAKLMAILHHERIVRLIGVAWDPAKQDPLVVSEYADGGDLCSLLVRYAETNEPVGFGGDKVKIALHVAEALHYLHSLDPIVLHRDLKSRNVLLTSEVDALLTDFGVSRERSNQTMTAGVGTSLWMAPEVMMGERYDEKADVFSFGVLLSEIDTHELPYAAALEPDADGRRMPVVAILRMVSLGELSARFSEHADADMVALGRACVSVDARDRPTSKEVLDRVDQVMRSYVAFV